MSKLFLWNTCINILNQGAKKLTKLECQKTSKRFVRLSESCYSKKKDEYWNMNEIVSLFIYDQIVEGKNQMNLNFTYIAMHSFLP